MWDTNIAGSLYWTTDPFAYNTFKILAGNGNSGTGAILQMPQAPINIEMDRYALPSALNPYSALGNPNAWTMLAPNWPASSTPSSQMGCFSTSTMCLVNPDTAICKTQGFTFSIWMKIHAVCSYSY